MTARTIRAGPTAHSFRKLYADLVAADGTVCLLYLASLSLCGVRKRYGCMELFRPDGERVVRVGMGDREPEDCVGGAGSLRIGLDLPDCRVTATYDRNPEEEPGDGFSVRPDLYWHAVVPRARARFIVSGGPHPGEMVGEGYVDFVELTGIARRVGLRRIRWGRVQKDGEAWVFNHLEFAVGDDWKVLLHLDREGRRRIVPSFSLVGGSGRGEAALRYEDLGTPRELNLRPERELYRGPAIDAGRSPGLVQRKVVEWLAGPMHQTRWLSRVADGEENRFGWAVHEEVRCG